MTKRHDFSVGQEVQFTDEAKRLFDNNPEHNGTFTIAKVAAVPRTNLDPCSSDYVGEQEGQDAVGHHQSLHFEGHDGPVSGALLEPAHDNEREWTAADQLDFDLGVEEFFDRLFAKAEAGEITYDQVERFFPRDVVERSQAT